MQINNRCKKRKPKERLEPFLKWAGGKRWLTASSAAIFPTTYNRYIEPFLGSGAIFFYLRPARALLADVNVDLIDTYLAIRDDWQKVLRHLVQHQQEHSRTHYYEIRTSSPRGLYERAARFIYLNRTCWNGLYRVNLDGAFNVPIGTKNNVLLDSDDFQRVAQLLRRATIVASDFEAIIDKAQDGDLLFVDPPYTVKHNINGFIKYNESLFNWKDQIRLRDSLERAKQRGAFIVVTNANHASVRSLYMNNFQLTKIKRHSVLAGDIAARKICSELLIRG